MKKIIIYFLLILGSYIYGVFSPKTIEEMFSEKRLYISLSLGVKYWSKQPEDELIYYSYYLGKNISFNSNIFVKFSKNLGILAETYFPEGGNTLYLIPILKLNNGIFLSSIYYMCIIAGYGKNIKLFKKIDLFPEIFAGIGFYMFCARVTLNIQYHISKNFDIFNNSFVLYGAGGAEGNGFTEYVINSGFSFNIKNHLILKVLNRFTEISGNKNMISYIGFSIEGRI